MIATAAQKRRAISGAWSRLTRSQLRFLWAIVMPVIALFILIRVIPIFVVLLMSFTKL